MADLTQFVPARESGCARKKPSRVVTFSPAPKGGASYKGSLIVGGFRTILRESRLSRYPTPLPVFQGTVTSTPHPVVCHRVPISKECSHPTIEATSNVGHRVDVCYILRHPTITVRTVELRLCGASSKVFAHLARLICVRWIHESHRNAGVTSFVLDTSDETRKCPVVKAAVHPLAIVNLRTNVQ